MSIISYAQNFEDVMLWRALGHIERGFYIDIGAQDPTVDSVSLAFHENNWRGIHVEPTPHYADLLRQQRPGDTVIQAAVGNGSALTKFFEIPNTGISTADASIAAQHRERGFDVHEIIVTLIPLSSIFDTCTEEIHWLKVDVEGFEKQLLSSWGDSTARPWIVVIESTLPLTQIESHDNWESIILGYGYSLAYFDGLNRFYVSHAHPELKAAFATPPNVFDGFTLNGTASAPFHRLIEERFQEKISGAVALAEKNHQAKQELEALQHAHAQRELEVAAQLMSVQQQAERDVAEIALRQNEEGRTLHSQLDWLQQERVTCEQALHKQTSQARVETENILRANAQREQEVAQQLQALQKQAEQDKAELVRSHAEQQSALSKTHVEQEQAYQNRLQILQEQLTWLQQERVAREQALYEETSQVKHEIEKILRAQTQRELEIAGQLQAAQRQSEHDKVELIRRHSEQEHVLRAQQAEREKGHVEEASHSRLELETLLRERAQREQQFAAQLLDVKQQAEREKSEQLRSHHQHAQTLQSQHDEQEKIHAEQASESRRALETLLRQNVEREQQIAAELIDLQKRAAREKTELVISQGEHARALQSQLFEREQLFSRQLLEKQQEVHELHHHRMDRAHEIAEKLLTLQQQAAESAVDQARAHKEQERILSLEHSAREDVLKQHLQTKQEEVHMLQKERARREQEMGEQLAAIQQQALLETAEQARRQTEQSSELHRLHADRERFLCQQLEIGRHELQSREQEWERREKEHAGQTVQSRQALEILLRDHSQREQEINTQLLTLQQEAQQEKAEHTRLLLACAAVETQLQAEMESGQQDNAHLRNLLTEVQHNLDLTQASLSWRLTAPLRKFMQMFGSSGEMTTTTVGSYEVPAVEPGMLAASNISKMTDIASDPVELEQGAVAASEIPATPIPTNVEERVNQEESMPTVIEPCPIADNSEPLDPTISQLVHPTDKKMPNNATTLSELLALHDQQFVRGAYKTLLGRSPDPEGFQYYLDRVRTGFSKTQIVAQLCLSHEGKTYASKLPGLDAAIEKHQKGQRSLIGFLFNLFNGTEGNTPTERKIRAIENQMFLFNEKSLERFNQIEAAIATLHSFIASRPPLTVSVQNTTPVGTTATENSLLVQSENQEELYKIKDEASKLSPRAREFYSQIKSIAANNAQRCL